MPPLGARVRVPFGRRERVGVVLAHPATSAVVPDKLRKASNLLDDEALLDEELIALVSWAAVYYRHPTGDAVLQALPSLLRKGRPLGESVEHGFELTALGREQDLAAAAKRAPKQASALRLLAERGQVREAQMPELGIERDVLARLLRKDWIRRRSIPPERVFDSATDSNAWPMLSEDQAAAVRAVREEPQGFRAFLLHGVTGSGKTEVYMQLMRDALAIGKQSLLLVPEIGLTPQLVGRLTRRFGNRLAVLHSALSDQERLDAWRRARAAEAKIVVGTRSAVLASLPSLGLIIVDEEHDTSFKQQTGFRYSARDLAIVRAQRLGVKIVLGSATPSLESYHNALTGRYSLLLLPKRIGGGGSPVFRTIDLNKHATHHALSTPLLTLIEQHLEGHNQVILFLNRRGFAPSLFCPACQIAEECDRCDARLTVHSRLGRLRCHHCGREKPLRWACPACGTERVGVGAGTQRVDEALQALLPEHEIARLDRDTTAKRGSLEAVLDRMTSGEARVLVGTQMLTKGHDFPNVTLVGILNADQGLFGTDFRSTERLAQTLIQVAGRAGRRDEKGEVVVQTHYPEHPLLRCLIEHGYEKFAELALAEREQSGWPPYSHVAVVRAEAADRDAALGLLRRARPAAVAAGVSLLGPAPSAMERQNGRYRAQLVVQSGSRAALHRTLEVLEASVKQDRSSRKVRWSVDVDPVEL